jgi:hypothetical protein
MAENGLIVRASPATSGPVTKQASSSAEDEDEDESAKYGQGIAFILATMVSFLLLLFWPRTSKASFATKMSNAVFSESRESLSTQDSPRRYSQLS